MNKSARKSAAADWPPGKPPFPGGHFSTNSNKGQSIQIALVADEDLSADEALGGLPMIWGATVIIWRCSSDEAQAHERSARFDLIVYREADGDGAPALRYSAFRRSSL